MSSHRSKLHIYLAKISIGTNTIMAIGKIILGILTASIFMCVNACYNIGMVFAKYYFHKGANKNTDLDKEYKYYRIIGIIIIISSMIFIVYSLRMFIGEKTPKYSKEAAIAIATITFFEIGINIKGAISAKKADKLMLQANKLINLSSSLISIVLTQTAIMSFTYKADSSASNGISGIVFGGCAAFIGVYMVLNINKKFKKLEQIE